MDRLIANSLEVVGVGFGEAQEIAGKKQVGIKQSRGAMEGGK